MRASDHVPDAGCRSGASPGWTTATACCSASQPYLLPRLQSVLNAAARLIFHLKRSDHISDALVSLHWLRVPEGIQYKVAVLGYRVLHGSAPRYLGPLTRVADVPGRRTLRSAATSRLIVQSVKLSTVGSRAFPAAASSIWNSLPEYIVSAYILYTVIST